MSVGVSAGLPVQHSYVFHGISLSIRGDPHAAGLLYARLRHFPPAPPEESTDAVFDFRSFDGFEGPLDRPAGSARTVYDYLPSAEVLYFERTDQLYLDIGRRAQVLACLSDGRVDISFLAHNAWGAYMATNALFTIPLMELGKRRGRYPVHAAALCVGDRALVLPGTSGAGKTTLVLALLRAGFDLLADDLVFLAAGREGLQVLGFPDSAGVTDETLALFPEVEPHLCPSELRLLKRVCPPEQVYGSTVRMAGRPAAVVFPRVAHADTSTLVPMSHDQAFFALLAQLRPTERRSAQGHLDFLARLARDCPCYRLETGRDLHAVPSLLRRVLE